MKKIILLIGLFFLFNSVYSQRFFTKELRADSIKGLNGDTLYINSDALFTAGFEIQDGFVNIRGINGINFDAGSDTDIDLMTIGVTDTPRMLWDESRGTFAITKTSGGLGFDINAPLSSDAVLSFLENDIVSARILWDESASELFFINGISIGDAIMGLLPDGEIKVFSQGETDPAVLANTFSMWAEDASGAGTISPNFKTEDGITIVLNQDLSIGSSPTFDATNITTSLSRVSELFSDFKQDNLIKTGWDDVLAGAGADFDASINGIDNNHDGIFEFKTGTTAGGVAVITMGNDQTGFMLGGGERHFELLIQIMDSATVVDDYISRFGFGDEVAGTEHENGIWFEYNRSVSVNWLLKTAKATAVTVDTSTVIVFPSVWIKLRAEINAAGTSVEYFIDGASAGTITTDMPIALLSESMGVVKTAGIINRRTLVDYYEQRVIYTTPR